MNNSSIAAFLAGLVAAIALGSIIRIILGMKLNLYLVNDESFVSDQAIIPITSDLKKKYFWKTLLRGKWKENIDLTLMNHEGDSFNFQIGYHLWGRYYISIDNDIRQAHLGNKAMMPHKKYYLRTGKQLVIGSRAFSVLVSPTGSEKILGAEMNSSSS
jgi:hypothetical protein